MPINIGKFSNKLPTMKYKEFLKGGLSGRIEASLDLKETNPKKLVYNLSSLDTPDGLYSRLEIRLGKDGKTIEGTMQKFLDDPSIDYLNAHPFGYAQTVVLEK